MSTKMEVGILELTQLPVEILEKICENLDSKSILAIRLTCSKLKSLIDTEVGIIMSTGLGEKVLDQYTKKKLKFICGVALKNIVIKDFIGKHEEKSGMRSYLTRKRYFDDIFRYPHFLNTIFFEGKVHVQFLHEMLTKCFNLEKIYFGKDIKFEGNLTSLLLKEDKKDSFKIRLNEGSAWLSILSKSEDIFRKISLNKLKHFQIIFRGPPITNNDLLNALLLLKTVRSKALEETIIDFSSIKSFKEIDYVNLSMIIAEFFEAHVGTLKRTHFGMDPSEPKPVQRFCRNLDDILRALDFQEEPEEFLPDEGYSVEEKVAIMFQLENKLKTLGKLLSLKHFQVRIPYNFHWTFWLVFMNNLQEVNTLHLLVSTRYKILNNCTFLKNSSKSLKRFRLDLDIAHPFDFSGIQECQQLEEIYLFNRPISLPLPILGPTAANIINVKLLPPGLKALSLGNVVVATEDLNKMLRKQKALDTLVIMNMWSDNPENGADCKILKKVFRLRSLQSCLIQGVRCMSEGDKALAAQMGLTMKPNLHLNLTTELDIVSTEVYRRYTWIKNYSPDGELTHYSIKFNDDDPYLL